VPTSCKVPDCPPGLVGDVAKFILEQAPRPVPEIALIGALAFVAGIAGRQYNVSATGLNSYFMLIAPTGTGKEAVAQGISKLVEAVASGPNGAPAIRNFIGPGEIRSDAALLKLLPTQKCFLSIMGEVGMLIKRMSGPRASPNDLGILRVWLDLWGKSGRGSVLNPMVYSDAAKSTDLVLSPAFTMLGESTPEGFYEALDETMVASGLLPRFHIIEYCGDRPDLNEGASNARPTNELILAVKQLVVEVNHLGELKQVTDVALTDEAAIEFRTFNAYCDNNIRGSRETSRQVWNRAHLKAMKLAAVVAVGIAHKAPVIDLWTAQWATRLVDDDARNIIGRFERGEIGDIGGNELLQQDRVRAVMRECIERPFDEIVKQYGGEKSEERRDQLSKLHAAGLVTHQYLQRRLLNLKLFTQGPNKTLNANAALKRAIERLAENAEIGIATPHVTKRFCGFSYLAYGFAEYDPNNLFEQSKTNMFFDGASADAIRGKMK
jgi:hypothetical protein